MNSKTWSYFIEGFLFILSFDFGLFPSKLMGFKFISFGKISFYYETFQVFENMNQNIVANLNF
jgi:hypothetical protein